MVYRLLGQGVVGGDYHKMHMHIYRIQNVSCASGKTTINIYKNGVCAWANKYPKIY